MSPNATARQHPAGPRMDLAAFTELLSPTGQQALAEADALAPSDATLLACVSRLQKRFGPALTRAAVETALLRRRARDKFARAGALYFTRAALEQASGEAVARHRARRFAGLGRVGDFCC